jgi:hypothetical protein
MLTKSLSHIPDVKALHKYFSKNARYNEDAPADSIYSCAGLFAGDTHTLFQKLEKAWKEDIKQHKPEKKEDIMSKTLAQIIEQQLSKEQAKKEQEEGGFTAMAKMQKPVEGKLSGTNSIKLGKKDEKKLTKINKKSSSVFADKKINTEEMLMKFVKALEEKRGVPEHPKAAEKKRRETESEHYGKGTVDAVHKTQEKLKGKKGITNPYALSRFIHEPQFAGEREHAHEKAAESRASRGEAFDKKVAEKRARTMGAAGMSRAAKKAAKSRGKD